MILQITGLLQLTNLIYPQVAQVFETPKAIECSIEASLENREESPHEEANPKVQVEEPVESLKDVNDNPDKIQVTTEDIKTESSEEVDRDIQHVRESLETGKPESAGQKTDLEKDVCFDRTNFFMNFISLRSKSLVLTKSDGQKTI